jgi:hypothetical protein
MFSLVLETFQCLNIVVYYPSRVFIKWLRKGKRHFQTFFILKFASISCVPFTISEKVKITALYCRGPIDTGLNCNTEQTQS